MSEIRDFRPSNREIVENILWDEVGDEINWNPLTGIEVANERIPNIAKRILLELGESE